MTQPIRIRLAFAAVLALVAAPALAQAPISPSDAELISRGRYIATAGDCAACHQAPGKGGSPFGGGSPIVSPLGSIYASNITPDKVHGIGNWTFEQFRQALTEGRSPTKGLLYPAMPYTAYASLSDDDLKALYTYLMKDVAPSSNVPPRTALPFPFLRPAMLGWNLLFLHGDPARATAPAGSVARGRYVAEALEHCSTCHTPRNTFFAEDRSKLLAGAQTGSWYAPNITPDQTGIGSWSDGELAQFLSQGHNAHAVAGGDMGLAVSRSLSKLQPDDISALVAYLRSVPPVSTPGAKAAPRQPPDVDVAAVEPQQRHDLATLADGSGVNGAQLYQAACAACHGPSGAGSQDGKHPNLGSNGAVLMATPDNLVMTIADGVHRTINGQGYAMPGFSADLDNAQIGALATYLRQTVGGQGAAPAVTAGDVARIRSGDVQQPWLARHAQALVIAALVLVALALALLTRLLLNRRQPWRVE